MVWYTGLMWRARRIMSGQRSESLTLAMRWRRAIWLFVGGLVAMLFAYGLVRAVPDERAVSLERRGVAAFRDGSRRAAEADFLAALRIAPKADLPRLGLVCTFLEAGHASRAMLELTQAFEHGLDFALQHQCAGLDLRTMFFQGRLGLFETIAVPLRSAPAVDAAYLRSESAGGVLDRAQRLLVASCLAYRAGLTSAGWYYAANAVEGKAALQSATRAFAACLGAQNRSRLGCDHAVDLVTCAVSERLRRSFLEDRPYVFVSAR